MQSGSRAQETLRLVESIADEAEVLTILEKSVVASGSGKGEVCVSDSVSIGHLLTLIKTERIHRHSFVTNGEGDFSPSEIDLASIRLGLTTGAKAEFQLNSATLLPTESTPGSSIPSRLEAETIAENYREEFLKLRTKVDFRFNFFWDSRTTELANSRWLRGAFSHSTYRSVLTIRNPETEEVNTIYQKEPEEPSAMIARLERAIRRPRSKRLPVANIAGGQSSAILSPWVVERICNTLSSATRLGTQAPELFLRALPDAFELSDDPTLRDGFGSAPFDHEGTPTKKTVLLRGPLLVSQISDLAMAARYGQKSSGNGFRRGTFFERASDLAPYPQFTNMSLTPGTISVDEVLRDHPEIVVLEKILIPLSQISEIGHPPQMVYFRGNMMRKGKQVAYVAGQNSRHRLISSPPETYGSLLDRSAVILREGELTYSGWFPYIYLPLVTW